MTILIKNARIIDPRDGLDSTGSVIIDDGTIKAVLCKGQKPPGKYTSEGFEVIEAEGMWLLPGLLDMHTHLREPGFEYKETIQSGTHAAVRGGITGVCPMPNTYPINDNAGITEFILREAGASGHCSVYPIGAVTKAQEGRELAELGMMQEAGCVAFSDDGRPVSNPTVMRRALEYTRALDVPIISHAEDTSLSKGGVMNEGLLSATMGLKGIPAASEEIAIFRDITLCELAAGRLHIAHVSTAGAVEIIRQAKKRGINVTAETCPHYFSITEDAVIGFDTAAKVNPPLRTQKDVEAIKEGLSDGTLDVIATDHAPHGREDKLLEFDQAPPGISGLETALPLSLALVFEGLLGPSELIEKMLVNPSKILGIETPGLREGQQASLVLVDPSAKWTVDSMTFFSKGKNSPFNGRTLTGAVMLTITGKKVYSWL